MREVSIKGPGTLAVFEGIHRTYASNKATVVEIRDGFGDLMALFCRHFNDDMWIFVTKGDPDWESHLVRLGYLQAGITTEELLNLASKPKVR